jgi:hypothetical protein
LRWIDDIRSQPGRLAIAAVVGLLVVVVLAGALELALHERVDSVTARALTYDVRLEDQGDDSPSSTSISSTATLPWWAPRVKGLRTSTEPTTIYRWR